MLNINYTNDYKKTSIDYYILIIGILTELNFHCLNNFLEYDDRYFENIL